MRRKKDQEREDRIYDEIVVDCYGEDEQMSGWCCYLGDTFDFPFQAEASNKDSSSPLKPEEMVGVVSIAEDDCDDTMRVLVKFGDRQCAVRLENLTPVASSPAATKQAVEDWKYWVGGGK